MKIKHILLGVLLVFTVFMGCDGLAGQKNKATVESMKNKTKKAEEKKGETQQTEAKNEVVISEHPADSRLAGKVFKYEDTTNHVLLKIGFDSEKRQAELIQEGTLALPPLLAEYTVNGDDITFDFSKILTVLTTYTAEDVINQHKTILDLMPDSERESFLHSAGMSKEAYLGWLKSAFTDAHGQGKITTLQRLAKNILHTPEGKATKATLSYGGSTLTVKKLRYIKERDELQAVLDNVQFIEIPETYDRPWGKQDVEKLAKRENEITDLEKQKTELQRQWEALERQREALEKQKEALKKQKKNATQEGLARLNKGLAVVQTEQAPYKDLIGKRYKLSDPYLSIYFRENDRTAWIDTHNAVPYFPTSVNATYTLRGNEVIFDFTEGLAKIIKFDDGGSYDRDNNKRLSFIKKEIQETEGDTSLSAQRRKEVLDWQKEQEKAWRELPLRLKELKRLAQEFAQMPEGKATVATLSDDKQTLTFKKVYLVLIDFITSIPAKEVPSLENVTFTQQ